MNHLVRRAAALVAAPVLASAAVVAVSGAPALAAPTTPPTPAATAAATWLATQTTAGTLPSLGQTLDFGVGLEASGAAPQVLAAVKTGVDARVASYATGNNSIAKAAWFYGLVGDPTSAGDTDLNLLGLVEDNTDDTTGALGGQYAQQWFGTLALVEGGSDEAAKSAEYLRSGQCADGGWGYSTPCVGEGDQFATYYSLAALASLEVKDAPTQAAIDKAVAFLGGKQSATGGFENCTEYAGPPNYECLKSEDNANDTGLAAWSLGLAGANAPAAKAAAWVAAHQYVSLPACGAAAPAAGAVSWTSSTFPEGVTEDNREQTVFATAQALAGLAYLPTSKPALSGPTDYVQAGRTISLKVSGLNAGERGCVSGVGTGKQVSGPGAVAVAIPAGTRNHVLTLSTAGRPATATVKALGATKFRVIVAKRVAKGKKVRARVTGLAPRESVTLRVTGKRVVRGTANANGVFRTVVKATGKVGKRKVTVRGEFTNRTGKGAFRVVR
ncbi:MULTISPECIES: hypothetical protein [unclassified Nocardioides]|uniref:hypothetical protein n=1 Tax=unclassified Nocardioides TaxID=2615069 RepID=UPI003014C3CA